jgi:hypothetical protein
MDELEAEVERLRDLLKVHVDRPGFLRGLKPKSRRKVRSLLREGEMTLNLQHVLDLLELAGVTPEEFFLAAYPPQAGEPVTIELPEPPPMKTPEQELAALLGQLPAGEVERLLGRLVVESLQSLARTPPQDG